MLSVSHAECKLCSVSVILGVIYAQYHIRAFYAGCPYAECRYAECRGATTPMAIRFKATQATSELPLGHFVVTCSKGTDTIEFSQMFI
jgi:hypothetical protein